MICIGNQRIIKILQWGYGTPAPASHDQKEDSDGRMKNKTRKEAVSQKSVGNQDGIANKQTLPSKEDKTRALNEANSLSYPSKTDQTNISSVMSQNKQLNLAKLRCPNNQEEHKSTNFFTAQVESQLKAGFHLDRVEEEKQNICNNKRRQKKVKHMKNKTCEAKQK